MKMITKGDSEKETALKFENQIPNPIFLHIWVEYCECWDKLKFWIGGLTQATFDQD